MKHARVIEGVHHGDFAADLAVVVDDFNFLRRPVGPVAAADGKVLPDGALAVEVVGAAALVVGDALVDKERQEHVGRVAGNGALGLNVVHARQLGVNGVVAQLLAAPQQVLGVGRPDDHGRLDAPLGKHLHGVARDVLGAVGLLDGAKHAAVGLEHLAGENVGVAAGEPRVGQGGQERLLHDEAVHADARHRGHDHAGNVVHALGVVLDAVGRVEVAVLHAVGDTIPAAGDGRALLPRLQEVGDALLGDVRQERRLPVRRLPRKVEHVRADDAEAGGEEPRVVVVQDLALEQVFQMQVLANVVRGQLQVGARLHRHGLHVGDPRQGLPPVRLVLLEALGAGAEAHLQQLVGFGIGICVSDARPAPGGQGRGARGDLIIPARHGGVSRIPARTDRWFIPVLSLCVSFSAPL